MTRVALADTCVYGVSQTGLSECTKCTSGYIADADGMGACKPCPGGHYVGAPGMFTCRVGSEDSRVRELLAV